MTTAPMTDWSQERREEHFRSVVQRGWLRMPPTMTGMLLISLACEDGPLTREEARVFVRTSGSPDGDWNGNCWDSEDLSELDEEELADHDRAQADASRYAAHYDLPPLRTFADIINLLIAAGVVFELADADGALRLHPATPLPRPQDVFPLGPDELAAQKSVHRDAAYRDDSYQIINMFEPLGGRRREITTSLDRLARILDGHPHDAREALGLLVEAGDFSTAVNVSTVPTHQVFRLHCDWERFDAHRIGIHGATEQGGIQITVPAELA